MSGNVKGFSLKAQDRKTKVPKLMSGKFFSISFFNAYDFTDIDECKGSHSCHVNATCTNTLGSHVCQCQTGYTGNGQNCTGEFNLFATICRTVQHDTFDYSAAPFSRVAK